MKYFIIIFILVLVIIPVITLAQAPDEVRERLVVVEQSLDYVKSDMKEIKVEVREIKKDMATSDDIKELKEGQRNRILELAEIIGAILIGGGAIHMRQRAQARKTKEV